MDGDKAVSSRPTSRCGRAPASSRSSRPERGRTVTKVTVPKTSPAQSSSA
jgi:hypothetical protein